MFEVKNIFKQEKLMLQLTFNPGLTLTGFRTTLPRCFFVDVIASCHSDRDVNMKYRLLTKCEVKMAGYWPSPFLRVCGPR